MPRGARRYVGPAFRAHHPQWSYAPTSGDGAKLYGGRFNKPGQEALYLSLTYEGAYQEAAGGGCLPSPMTLVSYLLDVEPVLDTFDPEAATFYDLPKDQLGGRDWEQRLEEGRNIESHQLSENLIKLGFVGMIVPSFVKHAPDDVKNIVLWTWSDDLPHKAKVHDPDGRLPKDPSSWLRL